MSARLPKGYRPVHDLQVVHRLKPGRVGRFELRRFSVNKSEADDFNLGLAFQGHAGRYIVPGTYLQLREDGVGTWMSDTPAEARDHRRPVREIRDRGGHVLIAGLGIGMVVFAALACENVERVTVLELNPDVIALVAPQIRDPRLEVVEADLYEWRPPKGARYSVVYLDIWRNPGPEDLREFGNLKRRFARCSDWRYCWPEDELKTYSRRGR